MSSNGTHLYWRIRVAQSIGPTYTDIAEVRWFDTNWLRRTTGEQYISSGQYSSYAPSNAFNDSSTVWSDTKTANAWVGIKFLQPVEIIWAEVFKGNGYYWRSPSSDNLFLEYSDDGIAWMTCTNMLYEEVPSGYGLFSSYGMTSLTREDLTNILKDATSVPIKVPVARITQVGENIFKGFPKLPPIVGSLNKVIQNGVALNSATGDFDRYGNGYIADFVKERPNNGPADGSQDYPVHRKVRLHRESDGLLVAETWSNKVTGAYRFDNINPNYVYTLLSYDHTGNFRAVVADRATASLY